MRVAVLGSGSWGTALALLLSRNGHDVALYGRDHDEIEGLRERRENFRYLPGFVLPESVRFEYLDALTPGAELAILAVPAGAARGVATRPGVAAGIAGAPVLVASKGLEPGRDGRVTQILAELDPELQVGVLSGPNLAIEIARGVPTAALVGFADLAVAERVRTAFNCRSFRVYVTEDVVGLELAGALKNVVAIGAGISDGLGFGDNTKGALLARGWREMLSLGLAMGAKSETFAGIAGIGDLFATASSILSRNYRLGKAVGAGRTLAEAVESLGQVAEGATTSEVALSLARRCGVTMPVFEAIDAVLRGRLAAARAVEMLMERQTPRESIPADHA